MLPREDGGHLPPWGGSSLLPLPSLGCCIHLPLLAWAALCCLGGSLELSILMEGGMSLGVAPKCPLPSSGETAGTGRWTGVGEFQPSQQFGIINHQGAPGKKQKVFGKIC